MNIKQYLDARVVLRNIKRFSMECTIKEQNLCDHGYNVATIFYILCDVFGVEITAKDLMIVMNHDFLESRTGDINLAVKMKSTKIKNAWELIESELSKDIPEYVDKWIDENFSEIKWKLFTFADRLDAYLYCMEEAYMGNARLEKAHSYYREALYNSGNEDLTELMETIDGYFS